VLRSSHPHDFHLHHLPYRRFLTGTERPGDSLNGRWVYAEPPAYLGLHTCALGSWLASLYVCGILGDRCCRTGVSVSIFICISLSLFLFTHSHAAASTGATRSVTYLLQIPGLPVLLVGFEI